MDNSFYASLLDDSNGDDDNTSNDTTRTQPPVVLSVILCRKSKTLQSSSSNTSSSSVRLAVAARIPRKRMDCTDPIQHTIQYFSFLDDRRRFTNLDALLTRLSPVGVVHLSCTESAEVS
uniref:Uncharacterized protein n=1 Tax=Chaetoceros debilis TaxID=122233 RepID=A0A7S3Q781_9STRA